MGTKVIVKMGAPRQCAKTHSTNINACKAGANIPESELRYGGDPVDELSGKKVKLPKSIANMRRQYKEELEDAAEEAKEAQAAAAENPTDGPSDYMLRNHVFLELQHPSLDQTVRLVFRLFDELAPLACANFRALCTGEKGIVSTSWGNCHLKYEGSAVHRIGKMPNGQASMLYGGDIQHGDGTGGQCIYGKPFFDEVNPLTLDEPGSLAMFSRRADNNDSKFIISLNGEGLAGSHVVFGKLASQVPTDALKMLGKVPTDAAGKPEEQLTIGRAGNQALIALKEDGDKVAKSNPDDSDEEVDEVEIARVLREKSKRAREEKGE